MEVNGNLVSEVEAGVDEVVVGGELYFLGSFGFVGR